ncbi:hypothetical protein [Paraburkholderia youngii]|uniref:hypothetical protein n=1 Tax=Paraburkholderia youngii TaxID=2782701 RepID=UPI003D213697
MKHYTDHTRPAPISAQVRRQLEADVKDLRATAKRKQVEMDERQFRQEHAAAKKHFEMGCWLFYYSKRTGTSGGFEDRVNCARLLFEAGFYQPDYEFFTAFEFGYRQFKSIFLMDDGEDVKDALRELAPRSAHIRNAFEHHGWSLASSRQASLAL